MEKRPTSPFAASPAKNTERASTICTNAGMTGKRVAAFTIANGAAAKNTSRNEKSATFFADHAGSALDQNWQQRMPTSGRVSSRLSDLVASHCTLAVVAGAR